MTTTMDDEEHDELPYPLQRMIDFSSIPNLFRKLVLFDDTFLNMQAINIGAVDRFATDLEYQLLRRYMEIEKTPVDEAMFLSAISQMWVFALYELLRTWRGRIDTLQKWLANGALNKMIERVTVEHTHFSGVIRKEHLEQTRDNEAFRNQLKEHRALFDGLFTMISDLRMNLAKHEVPGKKNSIAFEPGYGRINRFCGALDYIVDYGGGHLSMLNRRDIAEALRTMAVPDPRSA